MSVDYDPFGNLISYKHKKTKIHKNKLKKDKHKNKLTGEYGFSTKPFIEGLNWYYYGYRYYDAEVGRWLSRDPIGEEGGVSLYGFIRNDGINLFDFLGQQWRKASSWSELKSAELVRQGKKPSVTPSRTAGCGSIGSESVPERPFGAIRANFNEACVNHDLCWSNCAGKDNFETHQSNCDRAFLSDMIKACDKAFFARSSIMNALDPGGLNRCYTLARIYHAFVAVNKSIFQRAV